MAQELVAENDCLKRDLGMKSNRAQVRERLIACLIQRRIECLIKADWVPNPEAH